MTLDSPLDADHLTSGEHGPVAHLSRPIKLRTAGGSPERAHAMFIGKTRVHGVEFIDMGRTTAEVLDTTNNIIGRYPCHAHFSPDFEFTHVTVHASSEEKIDLPFVVGSKDARFESDGGRAVGNFTNNQKIPLGLFDACTDTNLSAAETFVVFGGVHQASREKVRKHIHFLSSQSIDRSVSGAIPQPTPMA